MKCSPLPCYLVPLRPKYSPFTPIQNNRQNYSSVGISTFPV
jgi:hypothetical protein